MKYSSYANLGIASLTVLACACSLSRRGSQADGFEQDPATTVDSATDGKDASSDGSLDGDGGIGPTDAGPSSVKDARDVVIGRYAQRRAFRTIQQVNSPLFNDDVRVLTTSYSLIEIQKQNGRYLLREDACRVVVENEGSFASLDVTIADKVPQSIPQTESVLEVEARGENITWVRPLTSAAVGWIPNGPNDALPTRANDPRVRDSDGDGNPGVSAYVKANLSIFGNVEGTLYLAQWNRARYAGTRQADGTLEGETFDMSEQNVLGSDSQALANNDPPTVPDPDRTDNRVLMVPLAMPVTCQTLLGQLDRIFP